MTVPEARIALLGVIEKIVSNSGGTSAIDAESVLELTTIIPAVANVPAAVVALDDDYTFDAVEDHNKLFTQATDAKTFTLPPTVAGAIVRLSNVGADAANILTIAPDAADGIAGTVTLAATVVQMDGTVAKDFILTKLTALLGDGCVLIGTGVTGTSAWLIVSSTGIWAQGA
tara:strand:- start:95879 stop:96394 length:516 start_codon:yes stop_codon:yes gene_type:complete